MPERKNVTELALNFFSASVLLLHPKDLTELDDPTHPYSSLAALCHIYIIGKRPRLAYVPGSIDIQPEKTFGRFRYIRDGMPQEAGFALKGYPNADSLEISAYPHTKLSFVKDGKATYTLPAHTLSLLCDEVSDESIRDLEVVYVGMAYGDGTRSAKDRLLSHSTLQQVLADLNADSPDDEALIIMFEYKQPMMYMSMNGRDPRAGAQPARAVGTDIRRTEELITEDVQIALVEAGLIRYFQPRYNDRYKTRFPHPTHKVLQALYELDYAALIVEIDTEDINARLFSSLRAPGYHHIGSVDLLDPHERQSFFNILSMEDGPDASAHSGPTY